MCLLMYQTTNKQQNWTFLFFNLFMFTREDGTTINNEDKKDFYVRQKAKIYSIL